MREKSERPTACDVDELATDQTCSNNGRVADPAIPLVTAPPGGGGCGQVTKAVHSHSAHLEGGVPGG